jgi:glycolate oxidase
MTLSKEAFKALQDCVGPAYVSQEPAILDGYAWQAYANTDPKKWIKRPVAVALPASTEEVQAIVKTCNKYGLKFKAFSTGWGAWGGPTEEGVVQIDLRRMDRIIDIDEKNMSAVVEPYVCGGQLQAEAMKRGLNCHIIGAGPNCSVLASATSAWGLGHDSIYMSYSARNVLGLELVTPDGEILKLGTCGSGLGWFLGDGPGPSLRGITRGHIGAFGGLGVFTKCSLKLFNWSGPAQFKSEGTLVNFQSDVPENDRLYMATFPNKEAFTQAVYMMSEAEIGYNALRIAPSGPIYTMYPHMFEHLTKTKAIKSILTKAMKYTYTIILQGTSKGDIAYQEKALKEIVKHLGGFEFQFPPLLARQFYLSLIRATMPALIFRRGGSFHTAMARNETIDVQSEWAELVAEMKESYIKEGLIFDDFGDNPYYHTYENGQWAHCEVVFQYDPRNDKQVKHLDTIGIDTLISAVENHQEPYFGHDPLARTYLSPLCCNFADWQKKISEMLDPNRTADKGFYLAEAEIDYASLDKKKREKLKQFSKQKWVDGMPPKPASEL